MDFLSMIPGIGSLLGGIGSIAGGIMSSNSAAANNQTQLEIAQKNIDMQKEFAQMGIRWKVNDAREAGLHPLAAIGAAGASYSPVQVALQNTAPDIGTGLGQIGKSGQQIAEAVMRTATRDEKLDALERTLRINRMGLENEALRTQIDRINAQPPFPSYGGPGVFGSGNVQTTTDKTGAYKLEPAEVTTTVPGQPGHVAGPPNPQVTWAMSPDGRGMQAFPPKNLGVEDEFGAPLMTDWYIRNRLGPNFNKDNGPTLPQIQKMFPGAVGARFDRTSQRWEPIYPSISDDEIRRSIHGPSTPYHWRRTPQRGAYIGRY